MSATDSTPKPASPYQNMRVKRGLRTDRIRPEDLKLYNPAFFCDDCGHYDRKRHVCTMGYFPVHTRAEQEAQYDLTGTMAFCRFCEID
jgi:ribosomal protein L32